MSPTRRAVRYAQAKCGRFGVLMSGLDHERVMLFGIQLRIMQACLNTVIPYVRKRKQFGKPIGAFQLMQAKIVDTCVALQSARTYVYAVARACNARETTRFDAAGAIDCSRSLGASILAGPWFQPLGVFSGDRPSEEELDRCAEVHREIVPLASLAGLTCALEPLNRFEAHLLNTCAQAMAFADRLGLAGFGILYDTFHANIEEKDPVAALAALHASGWLTHVHISENDRGAPGRGHAQIRETIAALRRLGYDRWLTIEAFGRGVPELAAATRVWREFFSSPEEVYSEGYRLICDCWEAGLAVGHDGLSGVGED